MKANVFTNNFSQVKTIHLESHRTMQDFSYIVFNDDIFAEDLALLLEKTQKSLAWLLKKARYDFSVFANGGIRIVRFLGDSNDGFNTESIKLRLNEEKQLAMFHNHPCDCHKEFSSFAWALWSFANDLILNKKGA